MNWRTGSGWECEARPSLTSVVALSTLVGTIFHGSVLGKGKILFPILRVAPKPRTSPNWVTYLTVIQDEALHKSYCVLLLSTGVLANLGGDLKTGRSRSRSKILAKTCSMTDK